MTQPFAERPMEPVEAMTLLSGTVGHRVRHISAIVDGERGAPQPSHPFFLQLEGTELPWNADKGKDASLAQRIKLVTAGDPCSAPPPPEVKGIGCTALTRKLGMGKIANVHTLCNSAPSDTSVEQ